MYAAFFPRLRVSQAKQVQRNGDRQRLSLMATRLVPAKMAKLVAVVQMAPSGLE
jgi:hypothetical protein